MWIGHFGCTVIHSAVVTGEALTILQGVTIGGAGNGVLRIGNRVSIGAGAVIIGEINIGDDATIGAGAVVTKDVAVGSRVGGVPARPIGKLSDEGSCIPGDSIADQ